MLETHPKGAGCTRPPQVLTLVLVGGKYFHPDSGPLTSPFMLLIKNPPVPQMKPNQDTCYTDEQF